MSHAKLKGGMMIVVTRLLTSARTGVRVLLIAAVVHSGCSENETVVRPPQIPIYYPDIDSRPRWSPDGMRIVYFHSGVIDTANGAVRIDPSVKGLWSIDSLEVKTFLIKGSNIHGEISYSGDRVAFAAGGRLFIANISASGIDTISVRQLTSGGSDHFPAWSPGDSLIAYESNADSKGYKVHVVSLDGQERAGIPVPSRLPDWFPDGKRLAYSFSSPGAAEDIAVFDLVDSTTSRLTDNGLVPDHSPQVSPAGDKILFEHGVEVWVMNSDGSNARFLVRGQDATWAPDGRRFAFVYWPEHALLGLGTIWVTDIDRSFLRQLTESSIQGREPSTTALYKH